MLQWQLQVGHASWQLCGYSTPAVLLTCVHARVDLQVRHFKPLDLPQVKVCLPAWVPHLLQEPPVAVTDPSHWDRNPAAMWQGADSYGSQGKRRAAGNPHVTTVDNQLRALVLHAANNIATKTNWQCCGAAPAG